jgi:hypothetical protein
MHLIRYKYQAVIECLENTALVSLRTSRNA